MVKVAKGCRWREDAGEREERERRERAEALLLAILLREAFRRHSSTPYSLFYSLLSTTRLPHFTT